MIYYKDASGKPWAIETEDEERFLPEGLTRITDEQYAALIAPTAAQLWAAHQAQAQAELDHGDKVCTRCMKAGVPYPAAWDARDQALRAIVKASTGDPTQPLPTRPAYPENT